MFRFLKSFFTEGHQRSVKARQHILGSFLFKGISILVSLVMVPLAIHYLNGERYGIWLTVTSVLSWFILFDMGLGNGMRNKFAEARAKGNDKLAQTYISTTYAIVAMIAGGLFLVFILLYGILPWKSIFGASADDAVEVARLVLIVFSFFCMQFVVKLINTILIADQRPAWNNAINAVASVIALGVIYVLVKTTEGSLVYLGIAISAANLLVPLVVSIWLFRGQYKAFRPTFKSVDFSKTDGLVLLGFQFFIMNGASIIVMSTDNMIITQLEGAAEVAPYQIAYKYFGVAIMGFTIITAPYWSAFTEAWTQKDMAWIRKTTKRVSRLWILVLLGLGLMLYLADWVFGWWVPTIEIPFYLCVLMVIWAAMNTGTMIFSNFLAGVGKIRLSVWHAVVVSIINIPLSWYFATTLNMGSNGVILASVLCLSLRAVFQPIQYFMIISGKARGIWDK
jgi:O-antigen/teichoic acid export membrane protein